MFRKSLALLAALTGLSSKPAGRSEPVHLSLSMDEIRNDPNRAYVQKGKLGKHRLSGKGRNWLTKVTSWDLVPESEKGRGQAARYRRQQERFE